jgi:hypothetical protein
VRVPDRLRFVRAALTEKDGECDDRPDGEKLGLPVLKRSIPESGSSKYLAHEIVSSLCPRRSSLKRRQLLSDCASQDARKMVAITSKSECS